MPGWGAVAALLRLRKPQGAALLLLPQLLLLLHACTSGSTAAAAAAVVVNVRVMSSPAPSVTPIHELELAGYMLAAAEANANVFPPGVRAVLNITAIGKAGAAEQRMRVQQAAVDISREADGVAAVFGPTTTAYASAARDVLEATGVPQTAVSAISAGLASRRFFRAYYDISSQARAFIQYMRSLGHNAMTMFLDTSEEFSVSALNPVRSYALEIGFTLFDSVPVGATASGAREALARLRHSSSRVVYAPTGVAVFKLLMAEASAADKRDFLWFAPYSSDWMFTNNVVFASEAGVVALDYDTLPDTPEFQALDAAFRALPPSPFLPSINITAGIGSLYTPKAYDSALARFLAVNRTIVRGASPTNHSVVWEELVSAPKFEGASGGVKFNALGDGIGAPLTLVQFQSDGGQRRVAQWDDLAASLTTLAPPSAETLLIATFTIDSCASRILVRNMSTGECSLCPPGMRNPANDGLEECFFCPTPLVLGEAATCVPCGDNQEYAVAADGEPACVAKTSGFDTELLLIIVACGCVLAILFALTVFVVMRWRELIAKRQDAEKKAAQEGQFVSFVFHELRNPLNGVVSFLDFASKALAGIIARFHAPEPVEDPVSSLGAVQDDLGHALLCSAHTLDVLDNVLDLSRLTAGKLELSSEPVDVFGCARQCTDMSQRLKPNIAVRARFAVVDAADRQVQECPSAFWVLGDRRRLVQVLMNLLSNAVKHTHTGFVEVRVTVRAPEKAMPAETTVSVDVSSAPPLLYGRGSARVVPVASSSGGTVSSASARVSVLFEVVDTGEGVPKESQEKIFAQFEQVGLAAGTGLGLSVSQEFVKLMGSRLSVESPFPVKGFSASVGSRFFFEIEAERCAPAQRSASLPLGLSSEEEKGDFVTSYDFDFSTAIARASASEGPKTTSDKTAKLPPLPTGWRVLVADDVARLLVRKLSTGPFKKLNWTFTEAETGDEALTLVRADGPFDIIILDEIMDKAGSTMRGSECAFRIRALEAMEREEKKGAEPGKEETKAAKSVKRALVVSCTGTAGDEALFRAHGIDMVWAKPVGSSSQLAHDLRRWI